MDFWETFEVKTELNNGLYFTAKFHSYNQRYLDYYYVITLYRDDGKDLVPCKRFGAVIPEPVSIKKELSFMEKRESIFQYLEPVAEKGKTNIPKNILWKGIGQENIDKL